jgi:hypothetical protein
MPLTNTYVQIYGQLPDVFRRISQGQAPDKFSTQHLKDIGFASSNFRAVIPLLKALGFLSADGSPTPRYHEYRNSAQSKKVMAEAIRDAYSDLFTITANPSIKDRELIEGKFKSVHNATPTTAKLMANTFFALLGLADLSASAASKEPKPSDNPPAAPAEVPPTPPASPANRHPSLHYNIQIHLPATKDTEVYNSIFKALKEHLFE